MSHWVNCYLIEVVSSIFLASLQTNMAKNQISRVDIRIGCLDQSLTKNRLGNFFFHQELSETIQKYENLCLKDTFGEKNL